MPKGVYLFISPSSSFATGAVHVTTDSLVSSEAKYTGWMSAGGHVFPYEGALLTT